MGSFQITVLGSSGALPAYGRFTSSQHLVIQNSHFLLDCGEGCQLQLRKYDKSTHKINHIFISHLHGDHYLGLMGLLFSMHLLHREHDLHIYSFRGLEEIMLAQLRHSGSSLNFKVILHPLTEDGPNLILENDSITVWSIPLDHKIATCGFLFREKPKSRSMDKSKVSGVPIQYIPQLRRGENILDDAGAIRYLSDEYTLPAKRSRSYAYCSDTQPSDKVLSSIHGVDLLYHEATFMEDEKAKARETRHSTAAEAAEMARKAGAGQLLIGHFSARYKDLSVVLAEARQVFSNTLLATEGETFEIAE
ncbi:MAG: ribonuclease Z [Cyclobacteriaceae bacterium]|nr:ribonuclease Z [Cyclobacteriaceae bacterium]